MTSLQKNIISMILPFALWAFDANSQIVVSSTFPSTQEINEEENLMGLIYSKSSPSLAVEVSGRCLLYTSQSPRDGLLYRLPSSA